MDPRNSLRIEFRERHHFSQNRRPFGNGNADARDASQGTVKALEGCQVGRVVDDARMQRKSTMNLETE